MVVFLSEVRLLSYTTTPDATLRATIHDQTI